MAKKRRKPEPDESGIIHFGMFIEDTNPRKAITDPEEMKRLAKEQVEVLNTPAEQWLSEVQAWLCEKVEQWTRPGIDVRKEPAGTTRHTVLFPDGVRAVVLLPDAPPQAKDCLSALNELQVLYGHLGPDGDRDWIVRTTFRLGQLVERVGLREFEPLVLDGLIANAAWKAAGENTAILRTEEDWRLFHIVREKHRGKYNEYVAIAREMECHGRKMSSKTASRMAKKLDEQDNDSVVQK